MFCVSTLSFRRPCATAHFATPEQGCADTLPACFRSNSEVPQDRDMSTIFQHGKSGCVKRYDCPAQAQRFRTGHKNTPVRHIESQPLQQASSTPDGTRLELPGFPLLWSRTVWKVPVPFPKRTPKPGQPQPKVRPPLGVANVDSCVRLPRAYALGQMAHDDPAPILVRCAPKLRVNVQTEIVTNQPVPESLRRTATSRPDRPHRA